MPKKFALLKPLFVILFLIGVVLIGATLYFATWFQPVNPNDKSDRQFVIPKGQALITIGQRLKEAGLLKNTIAFRLIVKKDNLGNKIQAGSFKLSPSMSVSEIARTLTMGTEDSWITIQEGWRAEEIAESLARQNFTNFDQAEFVSLAKDSEGKLFPDTYLIPLQISAQQFYDLLLNTYDRKVGPLNLSENDFDLTEQEVIILASLVEREGKGVTDMRNVAGILLNRLEIGMALQVDATLQYANGYDKVQKTWWREPLAKDKEVASPYNSYLTPGLPPTPICNPGLDAIQAVLDPLESDNLYYLHDLSGVGHYAQTYEEHLVNINKYLR